MRKRIHITSCRVGQKLQVLTCRTRCFRFYFAKISIKITFKIHNLFHSNYCFSFSEVYVSSCCKCCHYWCTGIAIIIALCVGIRSHISKNKKLYCLLVCVLFAYETAEFVMRPLCLRARYNQTISHSLRLRCCQDVRANDARTVVSLYRLVFRISTDRP